MALRNLRNNSLENLHFEFDSLDKCIENVQVYHQPVTFQMTLEPGKQWTTLLIPFLVSEHGLIVPLLFKSKIPFRRASFLDGSRGKGERMVPVDFIIVEKSFL